MINVLIGNRNSSEVEFLCHTLTNDRNYNIRNVDTGEKTISAYSSIRPNILVIDNNLQDMPILDIVNKLSVNPVERKKCNTILTVNSIQDNIHLTKTSKIYEILYKPLLNNELANTIRDISIDFYTPDLDISDIDNLLLQLEFNYFSAGYKYMREAILYCYYKPDELEFLTNITKFISYSYNVSESKVRDALKSSIRPFKKSTLKSLPPDLYSSLYNDGIPLSLKKFLERIVFYLIKLKKKR